MSKPLRVLIVEDSVADAELLLYELRQGGYDPTHKVVDAAEAMNDALDRQRWDVVLADYVMPNFGGLAALELLKSKGIDIPFIIVSGQIGEDIAVAAMKAGAHDYIIKGNLARLVPAVERELGDAEVRRERRKAEQERDGLMEQLRNVNERLVLTSMRNQEQSAELEAIIKALAEAVVVFGPDGELVRTNPIADELLGYSPTEREKPLMERLALLRAQTVDGARFVLEDFPPVRALRGETVRGVVAVIHRASDGKPVRVSISAAPISAPDGKILGAVAIYTAITDAGGQR